jgi:hypothetical protein
MKTPYISFEYSPLGIEKYFCIDGKRFCSIFEKNGQGWFFRTSNGDQCGELCESEEKAFEKMSIFGDTIFNDLK